MTLPIFIKHRKSILAVLLILYNFSNASSQCLYSNNKRVRFMQDSISSFDSQDAVKYAILPSIKKSQSCFEIRMYVYPALTFITPIVVIKSMGDSLVCTHYYYSMEKKDTKQYVIVGPAPNGLGNIYLRTSRPVAKKITPQIAEQLNASHLFTTPSWTIYLHKHKKIKLQQVTDGGTTIIEVKLDNHFRNFEVGDKMALNRENEYTESIKKIYDLFQSF